eukprot:COSAG01_NODE_646_length_14556_cov_9.736806_9_plen_157_part_00
MALSRACTIDHENDIAATTRPICREREMCAACGRPCDRSKIAGAAGSVVGHGLAIAGIVHVRLVVAAPELAHTGGIDRAAPQDGATYVVVLAAAKSAPCETRGENTATVSPAGAGEIWAGMAVQRRKAVAATYMIDCETPPTAKATSALWTRFRWM